MRHHEILDAPTLVTLISDYAKAIVYVDSDARLQRIIRINSTRSQSVDFGHTYIWIK